MLQELKFQYVKDLGEVYSFKYEGQDTEWTVTKSADGNADLDRITVWLESNTPTVDATPDVDLMEYVRSRRKELEEGGTTFNGMAIITRVDSNDELNAASLLAAPTMGNSGNNGLTNAMRNKCRIMSYGCYLAKDHAKNTVIRARTTGTNQSIPVGSVPTTIIWNNAFNDPGGFVDTTTGFIYLPMGRYQISASVRFNALSSGTENWTGLSLRAKDDSIYSESGARVLHVSGTRENISISQAIAVIKPDDGLFVKVWHTDNVAREIDAASFYQYLNIVRIGD